MNADEHGLVLDPNECAVMLPLIRAGLAVVLEVIHRMEMASLHADLDIEQ